MGFGYSAQRKDYGLHGKHHCHYCMNCLHKPAIGDPDAPCERCLFAPHLYPRNCQWAPADGGSEKNG
jgi:hypothetical protein